MKDIRSQYLITHQRHSNHTRKMQVSGLHAAFELVEFNLYCLHVVRRMEH